MSFLEDTVSHFFPEKKKKHQHDSQKEMSSYSLQTGIDKIWLARVEIHTVANKNIITIDGNPQRSFLGLYTWEIPQNYHTCFIIFCCSSQKMGNLMTPVVKTKGTTRDKNLFGSENPCFEGLKT